MPHVVTCQGCGFAFEAKMPHAKWCGETCRKAAQRKRNREAGESNVTDLRARLSLVGDASVEQERSRRVEPFGVMVALQDALDEVDANDPITRYRKAHAITLATVLDDPAKSNQWKGISEALAVVLTHLVATQKPGSADALAGIVAAIRGS